MSRENVATFRRAVEAYNRRDVEALVADTHPDSEWRPAILMKLRGKDTVYRGHEGVRQLMRDTGAGQRLSRFAATSRG